MFRRCWPRRPAGSLSAAGDRASALGLAALCPIGSEGGGALAEIEIERLLPWDGLDEDVVFALLRSYEAGANNPQQSWGFEGEPPEAVIKDSVTRDGTS